MIIERTEHPSWLSNAYLIGDGPGGHGVLVDSNGINEPLLEAVDRHGLTITHVLVTHHHHDHVVTCREDAERFGVPVVGHPLTRDAGVHLDEILADGEVLHSGDLLIRALETPGHCRDHLAFLVNETDCLTGDCLFKGTVGGTVGGGPNGFRDQVRSIMDVLMDLPRETRIHPGHREPSTIGAEWETNPFIRVWRGLDPHGTEHCRVRGEKATLLLWAPDYDGTHKAWVRFADGREAIVGGSQVERR